MDVRGLYPYVFSALVLGLCGSVCAGSATKALESKGSAAGVVFEKGKEELRLSNGLVELVLDRRNGYFRQIRNLVVGIEHKPPTDGVWPFGLWLGTREQPQQRVAEITADSRQRMSHRFQGSPEDGTLEMVYPSLVENATGKKTGVRLEVRVRFRRSWDYFVVTARLQNRSGLGITNFYAAKGAQLTGDASRDTEKVTTASFGTTLRKDMQPRGVKGPMTRGYPIYTLGWYDYQGQRASIGMAYVNRQGMMMMLDVVPEGEGIQQGWRMFNLKGHFHFEKMFPPEQQHMIYALEPGGELTTDEWVIAPHQGDWHRMADIYRERYNEVFKDDYVDYARSPQVARDVHLVLATWLAVYQVYTRPEEFVEKVKSSLSRLGVDPKRIGVSIHQGGTTWAKPMAPGSLSSPDFFPLAPEIGGTEAVKRAIEELKRLGIRWVGGYTWVQGNDPQARNYVAEADARPWVPAGFNPPSGPQPCIDNSAWLALWRDKNAPQYRELGDNSVYFDMGPMLWGICQGTGPAHLHGPGTVGTLTGSVRGGVRLSKVFREALGPEGSTGMETTSDVYGRWVDIWTARREPTLKYTWPDKIYFWMPATVQGLNDSLIYGHVPSVNFARADKVSKALDSPEGDPEVLASLRRFLDLREKLVAAPGYPDGFRDNLGLTVSDPNVVAKAFRRPGEGITVVYYAKAPTQAEIVVDGRALDNPQLSTQRKQVRLEKDEPGFWIVR